MANTIKIFNIYCILLLTYVCSPAPAANICSSESSCEQLIYQSQAKLSQLRADTVTLSDFVRDSHGKFIVGVTKEQAEGICKKRGGRLPSFREYILSLKNVIIWELADYANGKMPPGYSTSDALDQEELRGAFPVIEGNGFMDRFYAISKKGTNGNRLKIGTNYDDFPFWLDTVSGLNYSHLYVSGGITGASMDDVYNGNSYMYVRCSIPK